MATTRSLRQPPLHASPTEFNRDRHATLVSVLVPEALFISAVFAPAICAVTPIGVGPVLTHTRRMAQFSIRCHPSIPVDAEELEASLDARARELRAASPDGIIRLFRLTQPLPSGDVNVAWLLEAELPADEATIDKWLAETLRDLRLLGYQPTLTSSAGTTGRQDRWVVV
jgi:hypothetical protein